MLLGNAYTFSVDNTSDVKRSKIGNGNLREKSIDYNDMTNADSEHINSLIQKGRKVF